MLAITKIFRFEAAHAIHGYAGKCRHIHGHSYELHVTVAHQNHEQDFIAGQGILIDFKQIKSLMQETLDLLDHKLILSKKYLSEHERPFADEELLVFEVEPTAENLLLFLRNRIIPALPSGFVIHQLVLWETRDSYASWLAG
ncbi:MAG: 6-carboxytetrahydropterin synthase [Cyclobacteriaceae bacterium]